MNKFAWSGEQKMNDLMAFNDTQIRDHSSMPNQEISEPLDQARPPVRTAPFWGANQPMVLIVAANDKDPGDFLTMCRSRGIRTQFVLSGSAALIAYGRQRPDVIVLGEGLTDISVETVAAAIEADGNTPILRVNSAPTGEHGQEFTHKDGVFNSYTEVFFSPDIAVLAEKSRASWHSDEELIFGSLVMRPAAFEVQDNGESIVLTLREFELLRILILAQGQVVPLEQLKHEVWGAIGEVVKTDTVKVHMSRLRQKLTEQVQLAAVRGIGYVLKIVGKNNPTNEAQ